MAYETGALTVVPDHLGSGAGQPLKHAALLPIPGAAFAQLGPAILVACVHHADFDNVPGPGGPMLEIDFVGQGQAARRIELQLVVVAEPVKLRSAGDRPDGNLGG